MVNIQKKNGISLIVLVITILVMIILAGVVIVTMSENNPINKAKESKYTSDLATFKEELNLYIANALAKDPSFDKKNITKVTYDEMHGYISSLTKEYIGEIEIYRGNLVCVATEYNKIKWAATAGVKTKNSYLEVGDYISYPVTTSKKYTRLVKETCGDASNNIPELPAESLTWQVLDINEDGSIDIISSLSKEKISFSGSLGYNNAVFLLNDLCDKLYSSSLGKARSICIEDIEKGYTAHGKNQRDTFNSSGVKYGNSKTYTLNMQYPDIYAYEKGAGISKAASQDTGISVSENNKEYLLGVTDKLAGVATLPGLTAKQTYYTLLLDQESAGKRADIFKNSDTGYYVASRYAYTYPEEVHYGIRVVRDILTGARMYTSSGNAAARSYSYRVVVTLNNGVKINPASGVNTVSNPHQIKI